MAVASGPGVPRAPRDQGTTSAGLRRWLDRAVAILCVSALVPSLALAHDQLGLVHLPWLVVVAGAIAVTSLLMPLYAWSHRGIRTPAALFAGAVLLGLLTWPLAWRGDAASVAQPWLWICLITAAACTGVVFGHRIGISYLTLCALVYFALRISPGGGGVSLAAAVQDTLLAVAQPGAVMVVLHHARRAVAALDESVARTSAGEAEAAVKEALLAERSHLDALVHDEVMTTLVAAAHGQGARAAVAEQARGALAGLAAAVGGAHDPSPLTPAQFEWLLRDVVASVAPAASFTAQVSPQVGPLDPDVVRSLAQAAREVVLNASRHADAATITVSVQAVCDRGRPRISVVLADDGLGFDPAGVPGERLGLRVSVRDRLAVHGGRVTVDSAPGRGTRVTLWWEGKPVPPADRAAGLTPPLFERRALTPLGLSIGVLMTVYTLAGLLSLEHVRSPALALVGLALLAAATPLGLSRFATRMSTLRTVGVLALVLLGALAGIAALDPGVWPGNFVWFSSAVSLLLVLVRTGGRRIEAFLGAGLVGVVVALGAAAQRMEAVNALVTVLSPFVWLGLAEFFISWLARVRDRLWQARASSLESAAANATAFSKLVLREVWLADLQAQVEPLLAKLADPEHPLTDADRELCRVTEGTLRDTIRAANLTSPSLAAAIVAARRRGVRITLVDNRGSALPEVVRRATLRHLEALVRSTPSGRLVARTAPEGYDEAVTIVAVGADGAATLTTIGHDGAIAVRT